MSKDGLYEHKQYVKGKAKTVLKEGCAPDTPIDVRCRLPGNVILMHGVNDVGTCYHAVEEGLCAGLQNRLNRTFKAATYKQPGATDKGDLLDDPDAVFYKRNIAPDTDSPVIPFYWGYREVDRLSRVIRGQKTDRYGNRLDKDLSKGGGPFANATSTLPDMWNKGFGSIADIGGDAMRPLLDAPGRMYMVLAAQRLMALIAMIRDYDEHETVTVIAHSQGCLVTLLAQAMLAEKGLRPVDTLILTHPPYSLVEKPDRNLTKAGSMFRGGQDAAMARQYDMIDDHQTLDARLRTLINIVGKVGELPALSPQFATLNNHKLNDGAVGGCWRAETDRDNRGKTYLYFCPQDMTVALDNIQGIGWQGVPEYMVGTQYQMKDEYKYDTARRANLPTGRRTPQSTTVTMQALAPLGNHFYQRVFTNKLRPDPRTGKTCAVLVGLPPPYDYVLRLRGEDDHAHVESDGRTLRAHFPETPPHADPHAKPAVQRNGIRKITGEALRVPVPAVLGNAGETAPAAIPSKNSHAKRDMADRGPCEDVDPIDAEIAVTSQYGMRTWLEERPDPRYPGGISSDNPPEDESPMQQADLKQMTERYNQDKGLKGDDQRAIVAGVYLNGKFMATVEESPNEGRLRWQHELSAKSFHGSIIGNQENHRQVTAYDVAIGQGAASTDPLFYAYLCAVADWRKKDPKNSPIPRAGIPRWDQFLSSYSIYWNVEPQWRKSIIEGNKNYYNTGVLPEGLPVLTGKLWEIVISETTGGKRVDPKGGQRT